MKHTHILLVSLISALMLSSLVAAEPATMIVVQMKIVGEHTQPGDFFHVEAKVTNIGTMPATNVIVHIEGVPPEWFWTVTTPGDFSNILPGQSVTRVYSMTNQGGTPNILVWAWGPNTNTAYSNHIQLPIHPLVMGGLVLTMGGLFVFTQRKKS